MVQVAGRNGCWRGAGLWPLVCAGLALLLAGVPGAWAGPNDAAAKSKIYHYRIGGTATFSDQPPLRGNYVVWRPSCFACKIHSTINWRVIRLYFSEFSESIESAAAAYGVDPALVRAIIHAESRWWETRFCAYPPVCGGKLDSRREYT